MVVRGQNIELIVKAKIPTAFLRIIPIQVRVFALLNKAEFNGVKQILRVWRYGTFDHILSEVFMDPIKFLRENYRLALKPNTNKPLGACMD